MHTVTSSFSGEFPKKPGSQSGAQEVKILLDLNQPLPSYVAMANDLISLFTLAPPVKCRLTTAGFHQAQRWTFKWDECRGLRENEEFKMFFALLLKNPFNMSIRGAAK